MSYKKVVKHFPLINFLSLIIVLGILLACGKANSGGNQVEVILPNISGYVCFLIKDPSGTAVGGNCLKND